MKRTVEVKKEDGKKGETEIISETIMGKKLPPFKKIDTEQGFGMGNFFETYFQTIGTTAEPGKIKPENPVIDNLTEKQIAIT